MHNPARFAFPALIVASLFLAAGPWMVRLADVGPVASAFWRLTIVLPVLALRAVRQSRGRPFPGWALIGALALGGLFFAADLAAWHEGILRTRLANATLFGNMSSFLFALYGFLVLRALPCPARSRRPRWRSRPPAPSCCSAAATNCRPRISPVTCSPCSPPSFTASI